MARRRRWNEGIERVGISATVAALRYEGMTVDGLWLPEAEADQARLGGRRPIEAAFSVDGEPAGLDITTFWTDATGKGVARAGDLRTHFEGRLHGLDLDHLLIFASYEPRRVARLRTRELEVAADRLAEVVAKVDASLPIGRRVWLPTTDLPEWIIQPGVIRFPVGNPHPRVTLLPMRPTREYDQVMDEIRVKKGAQLAGWGLGIVTIAPRGLFEGVDDVQRAMSARDDWPFWRVYWLGLEGLRLAWEGPRVLR